MTGGSPSLRRRRPTVTVTVLVNGSACSSQTCSSRSSARRKAGLARSSASSTPNSLTDRSSCRPSRVTVRRTGSSSIPAARRVRARARRLAPGQRADAQHELGEVERLGQVVVGAQAQAADPVPGRAGRGQHQHHDPVVALGDHLAERVAVDAGQVAVEDDHVVGVDVELGRGLQPVAGDVDGHALVRSPRPATSASDRASSTTSTLMPALRRVIQARRRPGRGQRQADADPQPASGPGVQAPACRRAPRRSPRRSTGRARRHGPSRSGRRRAGGTAGPAADLPLVQHVAAVLDDQPGQRTVGRGGDADPAAVAVVADRVVDHVVDHPAQQRLAAPHPGAAGRR